MLKRGWMHSLPPFLPKPLSQCPSTHPPTPLIHTYLGKKREHRVQYKCLSFCSVPMPYIHKGCAPWFAEPLDMDSVPPFLPKPLSMQLTHPPTHFIQTPSFSSTSPRTNPPTHPPTDYLLSNAYLQDINENNPLSTGGESLLYLSINHPPTHPPTDYLLSNAYLQDINENNPLSTGGELVSAFASLLQKMWRGWDGGKPFYPPTHV